MKGRSGTSAYRIIFIPQRNHRGGVRVRACSRESDPGKITDVAHPSSFRTSSPGSASLVLSTKGDRRLLPRERHHHARGTWQIWIPLTWATVNPSHGTLEEF